LKERYAMNLNDTFGPREPIRFDRRTLLKRAACGFGYLAFAGLCAESKSQSDLPGPLSPKTPHHQPRAKRVIFLFMHGGPSQTDTFDYKPRLNRESGQPCPFSLPKAFDDENSKSSAAAWVLPAIPPARPVRALGFRSTARNQSRMISRIPACTPRDSAW
jgi:hypothetical protein